MKYRQTPKTPGKWLVLALALLVIPGLARAENKKKESNPPQQHAAPPQTQRQPQPQRPQQPRQPQPKPQAHGPKGQLPQGPKGQPPQGPKGQPPHGPKGQLPHGPKGQLPQGPKGQLPQGPKGQLPQGPKGQLPQGPKGQLPQGPKGKPLHLPPGTKTSPDGKGGFVHQTPNGSELHTNPQGKLTSLKTHNGTEARFSADGKVRSIHTAGGMSITHDARGGRVVETRLKDGGRVMVGGAHRGFVEHPFLRGGHPYLRRTYVFGGHPYAVVYRGYFFHGVRYWGWVPPFYYAPAFYAWAFAPWAAPVPWTWAWATAPWYGYYGYYFAPYPAYPYPALWLTDFLLAENLRAAYEAQIAAAEPAVYVSQPSPGAPHTGPVIDSAQVEIGGTGIGLRPGSQLYVFGAAAGGASPTGLLAEGKSIHVENASPGYTAAQIAATTTNSNSYTTSTQYHVIAGLGVSGFNYVQGFYGANQSPGAHSASVQFALTQPAMVALLGMASSQQYLTFSGLPNLVTDVPFNTTEALSIAHTTLGPGTYTARQTSADTFPGQDPNHMVDLLGVLVFSEQPAAATSSNPPIPMPSSIAASAPPQSAPAAGNTSVTLTPEVKQAISEQVKSDIAAEQAAATRPVEAPANEQPAANGSQVQATSNEQQPEVLDPKVRMFVVSKTLSEQAPDGTACSLSPGDILTRIANTPDANQNVGVLVTSSQNNDCLAGTQLDVSLQDLSDMHNDFREKVDAGLRTLADTQGKNGMPGGPPADAKPLAEGQAQPDSDAAAQLDQQQQDADAAEAAVRQAQEGGQGEQ